MQLLALGESFDGGDLMAFAGDRERQAGKHASPVHPDRARAAGALVAVLLGARQIEVLAQRVEEADTRLDPQDVLDTIDREPDRYRVWPARLQRCRLGHKNPPCPKPGSEATTLSARRTPVKGRR
jgi:hypothetical protein